MDLTLSIKVTGRVQGVFYRQSTREKARELGVTGSVKNMPDDSVLIIATGSREALNQLVAWCRQGPPRARVENVEIQELPHESFTHFQIERG
jgi:acylphosphatase